MFIPLKCIYRYWPIPWWVVVPFSTKHSLDSLVLHLARPDSRTWPRAWCSHAPAAAQRGFHQDIRNMPRFRQTAHEWIEISNGKWLLWFEMYADVRCIPLHGWGSRAAGQFLEPCLPTILSRVSSFGDATEQLLLSWMQLWTSFHTSSSKGLSKFCHCALQCSRFSLNRETHINGCRPNQWTEQDRTAVGKG